jgi:hypothetical protein
MKVITLVFSVAAWAQCTCFASAESFLITAGETAVAEVCVTNNGGSQAIGCTYTMERLEQTDNSDFPDPGITHTLTLPMGPTPPMNPDAPPHCSNITWSIEDDVDSSGDEYPKYEVEYKSSTNETCVNTLNAPFQVMPTEDNAVFLGEWRPTPYLTAAVFEANVEPLSTIFQDWLIAERVDGVSDSCYFVGSTYDPCDPADNPHGTLLGPDNNYDDWMGYPEPMVTYYRTEAASLPCGCEAVQTVYFQVPPAFEIYEFWPYDFHSVEYEIGSTDVSILRDNVPATKTWP